MIEKSEQNNQLLDEKDNIISTLQETELNSKNKILLLNEKINKILNEKDSEIKKLNTQISELESKIKIEQIIQKTTRTK